MAVLRELVANVWSPKPIIGINQEFARFLNQHSWGYLNDEINLAVVRGLTADPVNYNPLDHPEVVTLDSDYIRYARFVRQNLNKMPIYRQGLISLLDEIGTLGWYRENSIQVFVSKIKHLRSPLYGLQEYEFLHPSSVRFLQAAAQKL